MTGLPFASLWCLNSIEWCIITCALRRTCTHQTLGGWWAVFMSAVSVATNRAMITTA